MQEVKEYEESISLLDIYLRVKQHILFIIISVVTCVGLMGVYSLAIQKPEYVAKSSVIMASSEMQGSTGLSYGLNIVDTYKEFIVSSKVVEELKERGFTKPFEVNVTGSGTLIVYITITSHEEKYSIDVANNIITVGNDIIASNAEGSMKSLATATPGILDVATRATTSRHLFRNVAVGGVLGIVISACYVFIMMLISNTYMKQEEVERELGLPLLSVTQYVDFTELDENGLPLKRKKHIK